jgi:predicted transcriptional regulator
VTLDDDLAARLKELAHQRRASFKTTLNETLRRGLSAQESAGATPRFAVEPHAGGFRPGIDQEKLGQLLDTLETDEFSREARSGS